MHRIDSFDQIATNYDGILFDAFGVLLDDKGALPKAPSLLQTLKQKHIPFWVLTNGSSKLEEKLASKYQGFGLDIKADQIITSGSLLARNRKALNLQGAKVSVLGTDDSVEYAKRAGADVVEPLAKIDFDALIIANQTEYPLLDCLDWALSESIKKIDRGDRLKIIITNPDLFYPKGAGEYGVTAGSLGLILEESLKIRFGSLTGSFMVRLGKPFSPIFDAAIEIAKTKKLLMVGDQLQTDIAGANNYGIESLLVTTGLTPESMLNQIPKELTPTFVASGLQWEVST